MALLNTESVKH